MNATATRKTPARRRAPAAKKATPARAPASVAVPASALAPVPAAPAAASKKAQAPSLKKNKVDNKVRQKLVRDSFTMPQSDYELIAAIKQRCIKLQRPAKKSEVLRAGLHVLAALKDAQLLKVFSGLVEIKSGRPKKGN